MMEKKTGKRFPLVTYISRLIPIRIVVSVTLFQSDMIYMSTPCLNSEAKRMLKRRAPEAQHVGETKEDATSDPQRSVNGTHPLVLTVPTHKINNVHHHSASTI